MRVDEAKAALRAASGLGIEAMARLPAHAPAYGRAWTVELGGVFTTKRSDEVGGLLASLSTLRKRETRARGGANEQA